MAKFDEILEEYLSNPHWRKLYENAPSEACKIWYEKMFYYSETGEGLEELSKAKKHLRLKDWEYLAKYNKGTPFYKVCLDNIARLKK